MEAGGVNTDHKGSPTMTDIQTESGEDIGRRISEYVSQLGLSFPRLGRLVYERIGAYAPNDETLRAWGKGTANPEKIDPIVVAAMADVFGCSVADLSVIAAQTLRRVNDLLDRTALAEDDATLDAQVLPEGSRVKRLPRSRCVAEVTQPTLPWDASTELPDYALDVMIDLTDVVRPMAFAS